jgi:ABC-type nitrate/sulfonate/bicarbonate transport system permease component
VTTTERGATTTLDEPDALDAIIVAAASPGLEPRTDGRRLGRRVVAWFAWRIGIAAVLWLAWWLFTNAEVLPSYAVPGPSAVWNSTTHSLSQLRHITWITAEQVLIALLAIWIVGTTAGCVIGLTPRLWPLLGVARGAFAIPISIVFPLIGVWFGVGATGKPVFGFLAGVLPMTLTCAASVRTVDRNILTLMESLNVSYVTCIRKAVLPASLPGIVNGMRLSGSLGLSSVVAGEMLLSDDGLGYTIANAGSQFDAPLLFECVIVVVLFAIVMHSLIGWLEAWATKAYS